MCIYYLSHYLRHRRTLAGRTPGSDRRDLASNDGGGSLNFTAVAATASGGAWPISPAPTQMAGTSVLLAGKPVWVTAEFAGNDW
jgi:hypothetical protein